MLSMQPEEGEKVMLKFYTVLLLITMIFCTWIFFQVVSLDYPVRSEGYVESNYDMVDYCMKYHGVLSARKDNATQLWYFYRNNKTCRLINNNCVASYKTKGLRR